jgi:DNA repair exonuclease SbcCD ATPase subunit
MPLTKYTGSNLKKLKKDGLICHILELYSFIDLFDHNAKTIEENEKLKEDINDYENGIGKYDFDPSLSQKALCKIVNEWELGNCHLHDEIAGLKKENEKIIVKKNKFHKWLTDIGYTCIDLDGDYNVKDVSKTIIKMVEDLKKENEKLKKENEAREEGFTQFKEEYDIIDEARITFEAEMDRLKKENEKLKIDMINHTTQNYAEWEKEQETLAIGLVKEDLKRAEEEIEKLKKEIEKLKGIEEGYEHIIGKQSKELRKYLEDDYKIMKDNKKLKAEIEKLKKDVYLRNCVLEGVKGDQEALFELFGKDDCGDPIVWSLDSAMIVVENMVEKLTKGQLEFH